MGLSRLCGRAKNAKQWDFGTRRLLAASASGTAGVPGHALRRDVCKLCALRPATVCSDSVFLRNSNKLVVLPVGGDARVSGDSPATVWRLSRDTCASGLWIDD